MPRIPERCELIHRHWRPVLLLALLGTLAGGYLSSKLTLQSDLAELLPDSFESVQAMERMREEVGGVGNIRVVLESDSFPAMERLARALEPRLEESEYVRYVAYENDVEFYRKYALLYLDTTRLDSLRTAVDETIQEEKQQLNPFLVDDLFGSDEQDGDGGEDDAGTRLEEWEERYSSREPRPYYTDPDSSVLVMDVLASRGSVDLDYSRAMLDEVEGIVEAADPRAYAPDLEVYYGGNIKNRIDEYETVSSDILGTALYGIGGVFLLILLYFRSFTAAGLVAAGLFSSLTWTFGFTYLVVGQLNTITGFLFVILFGLGIDYGIHAFVRYREARQAGLDRETGLHRMVCGTGSALRTTALTTCAAFFSLMLMDFRGFSELGFIAGTGIIFVFLAMVVVLPALVILAEEIGLLRIEPAARKTLDFERRPFRHSRLILAVGGAISLTAVYGFARVDFQYDFTDLRVETEERRAVGKKTRDVFTLSESPALVLAGSREEAEQVMETVRERIRTDTLSPTVDRVRSVHSLVPDRQEVKLEKIREIRRLVREEAEGVVEGDAERQMERLESYLAVDEPFTWEDLPRNEKRQFLTRDGRVGNFVLIYPDVPLRDGRNAIAFRQDIGTITTQAGNTYHAASANIILAEMLEMVIREGKLAVALTLGVVFLILLVDFRSLRAAVLVVSPLVVGLLWMGGGMQIFGMKLNLFNIVAIPSVIGIGVDNGVHIFHRHLEEGPGSLYMVLRTTGVAVALATLTTITGYSGLILATHPGLQSIGKLAVIGLSATFLSAVLVLPALTQLFLEEGSGPLARARVTASPGRMAPAEVTREGESTAGDGGPRGPAVGARGGQPAPERGGGAREEGQMGIAGE